MKTNVKQRMFSAYGMTLHGRKYGIWMIEWFFLFAALCKSYGVSGFIDYVYCCNNSGMQVIELKGDVPQAEKECIHVLAHETLGNYWLDGEAYWGKNAT